MTRRGVLGLLVVGLTTASCTADAPSSSQPQDSQPQDSQLQDSQPQDSQLQDSQPQVSQLQDSQPRDDDATAAAVICTELRDQVNTLVDIANAAVADIGGLTPAERTASILAGYDDALAAAAAFAADVAAWEVPDIPERDRLIAEVGDGARAAIAELDDERAIFARDVPAVADDDVGGRVGQFFNGIEKAQSVVEPAIAAYDRVELQRAFLDEPACRHVIQPFVVDG